MIPSKLQRYVLRETIYIALLSTLALTAIFFIGMSVVRVQRGLSIIQLRGMAVYVLLFSLPYAVPTALLVTSVFVFGRLSGANELTAISGSGVRLSHIILPPVFVALVISAGTFMLNHYLMPASLSEIKIQSKYLIDAALKNAGQAQRAYPIGPYMVYVGGVDKATRLWKNVAVVEFGADDFPKQILLADRGTCSVDQERQIATLTLSDVVAIAPRLGDIESVNLDAGVSFGRMQLDISLERPPSSRPKYLNLPELREAIRELRAEVAEIRANNTDLARLRHPKTARAQAEKEENKSYQAWSEVRMAFDSQEKALAEARADVESARVALRASQASYETAIEARDEAEKQLKSREQLLEELRADVQKLRQQNGDPSLLVRCLREFRTASSACAALKLQLQSCTRSASEKRAALKAAHDDLAAERVLLRDVSRSESVTRTNERQARKAYEKNSEKLARIKTVETLLRTETVFHFRNAGALTSLMFVLIGIPLGILSRRGNVIIALALSFFTVLIIYYPLTMIGKILSLDGYLNPIAAQWMPNVVVGGIGVCLLLFSVRR